MKTSFLRLAPPASYLNQPFNGESEGGGGGMTRRRFLKRTGGATVASFVAFNLAEQSARGTEEENTQGGSSGSVTLSARIETQHRMKCVYEPPHTDGSITWLGKTTYSGNGEEGYTTLKSTGPSKNTTAFGEMTKVEAHVLSTILVSESTQTEKVWAKTVLKMPGGALYGGKWLKPGDDSPNFEQVKSDDDEQLNDPKVNLEVKAYSAAMNFSHSGYFIDLVKLSENGNEELEKTYKTTNGSEQTNEQGAKAELGTAPPSELGGSLTKDGISLNIKGGILPFTGNVGYEVGGKSTRTEEFEKITGANETSSWQTTQDMQSSCSGNVFAGWCIYHETRTKRVSLRNGAPVSEEIIEDWKKIDQLGINPDETNP